VLLSHLGQQYLTTVKADPNSGLDSDLVSVARERSRKLTHNDDADVGQVGTRLRAETIGT
jgi:hypothetical protein